MRNATHLKRFCYLAAYGYMENGAPMTACRGRLIRAHIIPKQVLKRYDGDPMDPRSWVWACGGIAGIGGHHGAFDSPKTLRLRRVALPSAVEDLAAELGIEWWLCREFGEP